MKQDIAARIETISIATDATIREAMQAIDKGELGLALLVNPYKRLEGVITDGDLRRALLAGHGLETSLTALPRRQPITASVTTPASDLTHLFSNLVRVVPLLNDAGQVVDLAMFDSRMRLPVAEPSLGAKELLYVTECVVTGWVSSAGRFVHEFEEQFAAFCGVPYAIATSNGTTALHLALLALGIGAGDEVIVPTLTFIASANAVTYTGATPVFVDSEPDTWNLDPAQIERLITPRTKAIMVVHLYGHPANMAPIMEIAQRHNLKVIEDAAEAHGACYKQHVTGSIGDIATFSFYGNKIITTGEGGMVVTKDEALARQVRMLRDHGMSPEKRYWHPIIGYNYRLTNIQAALGVAQMERIDTLISARREHAALYLEYLSNIPGIILPPEAEWATNVYWLFCILIDKAQFGMGRDEVMQSLAERGIETRPLFYPIHQQPIYLRDTSYPVAEYLSQNGLSLPSSSRLKSSEIRLVAQTLRDLAADH